MAKNAVAFITFILVLSLNITTNRVAIATGPTYVKVDPSLIEYHTNAVGQQFTIAVEIVDVENLYGFDIKLRWNTTYLEYINRTVHVPKDNYTDGILWKPILQVKDEVNASAGTYWIVYASMWPAPSFNGSGTVFTMTFRIKYQPVQPEPDVNITLELYSVDLANTAGDKLPYIKQDGTVTLCAVSAQHNITVLSVNPLKTIAGQGYTMNINVTVANQGDYVETFNVTAYANTTAIETREIALQKGTWTTITFTWNTIGYAKGNYALWVYAWPVLGETDTSDNTFSDGIVYVGIPGDINGDGTVDIYDAILLSTSFGAKQGDPNWNPNADLDNTGEIDIFDAIILSTHFGETDP
ncbi:MAG: CARDB domain-containing protein [Candidatus Bathyarchaeia archaeon]